MIRKSSNWTLRGAFSGWLILNDSNSDWNSSPVTVTVTVAFTNLNIFSRFHQRRLMHHTWYPRFTLPSCLLIVFRYLLLFIGDFSCSSSIVLVLLLYINTGLNGHCLFPPNWFLLLLSATSQKKANHSLRQSQGHPERLYNPGEMNICEWHHNNLEGF